MKTFLITTPATALRCPKCGSEEMHPNGKQLLLRGYKVCDDHGNWWSQCLVCCGAYDANLVYDEARYNADKGWFK